MSGTRREFLRKVAQAGGYRATYLTMQAMGLLGTTALAEPLTLEPGHIAKDSVIIIPVLACTSSTRQSVPFSVWSGQAG